jgi:hypothetical protein
MLNNHNGTKAASLSLYLAACAASFKVEKFANAKCYLLNAATVRVCGKLWPIPPDIYRNRKNSALHKSVFGGEDV